MYTFDRAAAFVAPWLLSRRFAFAAGLAPLLQRLASQKGKLPYLESPETTHGLRSSSSLGGILYVVFKQKTGHAQKGTTQEPRATLLKRRHEDCNCGADSKKSPKKKRGRAVELRGWAWAQK